MCTKDQYDLPIDTSPYAFADYRARTWPFPSTVFSMSNDFSHYTAIYDAVRATGLPNCLGARIPLPSSLNLEAWRLYIDTDTDEVDLLQYLQFGFPLGYLGPISPTHDTQNHDSASRFPAHIDHFISTEKEAGAMIGPFNAPPFAPWVHVSPLMSRPKADPGKRRVITDLTFPADSSINAYVMKNSALGEVREHTLPSFTDLVTALRGAGPHAHLFTIDIARAYKNFMTDPLDWPLLCTRWNDNYFLELSMPFGARGFMQRIANVITRLLRDEGITALMYLDDVIVVAPDAEVANVHFDRVRTLLAELGLPEAVDKAKPPSTSVRWLGIDIDAAEMSLSIPHDKVQEALYAVRSQVTARSINKKQLQSLIGRLVHVAKCVEPARIFISHLLEALRAFGDRHYIKVTEDMRADADLRWFLEFLIPWNGVSLIPKQAPHKVIQVDACLTGVGATDGSTAYAAQVTPLDDPVENITEIEAANVIIALHTFVTPDDAGGHILVQCDNLPAVQAITTGRARNPILAECARAAWMLQARYAINISFSHIAGVHNQVADALSRAHTSTGHHNLAAQFISDLSLTVVHPCTHILSNTNPPIFCRSRTELAGGPSGGQAGSGPSTWHHQGTSHDSFLASCLLPAVPDAPQPDDREGRVPMDRVSGQHRDCSPNHKEQTVPRMSVHETDGRLLGWLQPPKGRQGSGRHPATKGSRASEEIGSISTDHTHSDCPPPGQPRRVNGQAGHTPHVLRRAPPVGGGSTWREQIRPSATSYEGRCLNRRNDNHQDKGWKKSTAIRPTKDSDTAANWRRSYVPSYSPTRGSRTYTRPPTSKTTTGVQRHTHTNAHVVPTGSMGPRPYTDRRRLSLHSLRKASATLAHTGGCSDLEVQRHGGWTSNAYRTYIQTDSHKVNDVLSTSPI